MAARLRFQVPQPTTLSFMGSSLWISIQKRKICKSDIYKQVSQFPNPLFFGILIIDKEEYILSLKLRDFILEIKESMVNHTL